MPDITSPPNPENLSSASMDRYGMAVSLGCAVHCAAMPVALTTLSTMGMGWLGEPAFEWTILLITFAIGSTRLVQSYRVHRNPQCLILFAMGLLCFTIAKAELTDFEYSEPVWMTLGGILVAIAHFRNLRLHNGNCGTACDHAH